MRWIHNFTNQKIPFYIYKLNHKDSLIYTNNNQLNQTIIILHGILLILKVFTNGEILSVAILRENNIINIKKDTKEVKHYYYKAIALEETWLISIKSNYLYLLSPIMTKNVIKSYYNTLHQYELMNQILVHKEAKYRMIQLIVYLSEQFGYRYNNYIYIRFNISQSILSLIIGANKITINKIIKILKQNMAIKVSKNKIIYINKK